MAEYFESVPFQDYDIYDHLSTREIRHLQTVLTHIPPEEAHTSDVLLYPRDQRPDPHVCAWAVLLTDCTVFCATRV
jgi:hypothetical protein